MTGKFQANGAHKALPGGRSSLGGIREDAGERGEGLKGVSDQEAKQEKELDVKPAAEGAPAGRRRPKVNESPLLLF